MSDLPAVPQLQESLENNHPEAGLCIKVNENCPLDLHSPLTVHANNPEVSPTKSNDSKTDTDSPTKNRRKRKPTKKVTASDLSLSENDMETNNTGFDFDDVPSSKISKNHESDECETIDKIAQMVSNITSTSVTVPPNPPEIAVNPDVSDEMIEDQLKQMFGDSAPPATEETPSTTAAVSESESTKKKKGKPRKKKEPGTTGRKKKGDVAQGKMKNGKPGKKKKAKLPDPIDDSMPEIKLKSKENGGKSKAKIDVAPFVQIQKDGSFTIINQTANGDEDTEKTVNKTKKVPKTDKHKVIRGLHMSTLSNKYDAEQRDLTWICVFCKLGPHKNKLGDLFGPYIITKTSEDYQHCLQDPNDDIFRQNNKNKFIKSPPPSPEKSKKKKKSNTGAAVAVNGEMTQDEIFSGMSKVDDTSFEVWMHEDCIVWAPGVYMIGTKIIGMEKAIWSSTRYRCSYCNLNGAMMSCLSRECRKPAHFGCARKGWKLDEEFKTYCEIHH